MFHLLGASATTCTFATFSWELLAKLPLFQGNFWHNYHFLVGKLCYNKLGGGYGAHYFTETARMEIVVSKKTLAFARGEAGGQNLGFT